MTTEDMRAFAEWERANESSLATGRGPIPAPRSRLPLALSLAILAVFAAVLVFCAVAGADEMRLVGGLVPGSLAEFPCKPGETHMERCNTCTCLGDGRAMACTTLACVDYPVIKLADLRPLCWATFFHWEMCR